MSKYSRDDLEEMDDEFKEKEFRNGRKNKNNRRSSNPENDDGTHTKERIKKINRPDKKL